MTVQFQLKDSTDNYAVLGNPVAHSLSPKIHSLFAAQLNHSLHYQAIEVVPGSFQEMVEKFFQAGGKGLNITVPFKEDAFSISSLLSEIASLAGAVNTLEYHNGNITGHNTDGPGLIHDLTINHQITIKGKKLLILGAGGAVRGILGPIIQQQPEEITIANRTIVKAEKLAEIFSGNIELKSCSFSELSGHNYDLLINGTSASLKKELPPLPEGLFKDDACSYDMMYSSEVTLFQEWSRQQGVLKAYDGLGMLVEQAAEAFFIWRGVRPDTLPVLKTLREA